MRKSWTIRDKRKNPQLLSTHRSSFSLLALLMLTLSSNPISRIKELNEIHSKNTSKVPIEP